MVLEANLRTALRRPTEDQVSGPFYPVIKPVDQDADLTVIKGKSRKAQGKIIHVKGRVFNMNGKPVPGVKLEIWQANTFGRYTHPEDTNPAPLDPNFEGYGVQTTDEEGRYWFKTVKPGAYPIPGGRMRPPHIHFCITSKTNQLITQLYFEGEPLNEKDILFKNLQYKESVITRLSPPAPDMEADSLIAPWDIVLGQT